MKLVLNGGGEGKAVESARKLLNGMSVYILAEGMLINC